MRFSNIALAYFVIAAMMWGGGAINWDDSGLAKLMLTNDEEDGLKASPAVSGAIEGINSNSGLIGTLGGGLLIIWDVLIMIIGATFWPVTVLIGKDTPLEVVVALGGSLTFAFLMAFIRLMRRSA
jgi:hypothetical protein